MAVGDGTGPFLFQKASKFCVSKEFRAVVTPGRKQITSFQIECGIMALKLANSFWILFVTSSIEPM